MSQAEDEAQYQFTITHYSLKGLYKPVAASPYGLDLNRIGKFCQDNREALVAHELHYEPEVSAPYERHVIGNSFGSVSLTNSAVEIIPGRQYLAYEAAGGQKQLVLLSIDPLNLYRLPPPTSKEYKLVAAMMKGNVLYVLIDTLPYPVIVYYKELGAHFKLEGRINLDVPLNNFLVREAHFRSVGDSLDCFLILQDSSTKEGAIRIILSKVSPNSIDPIYDINVPNVLFGALCFSSEKCIAVLHRSAKLIWIEVDNTGHVLQKELPGSTNQLIDAIPVVIGDERFLVTWYTGSTLRIHRVGSLDSFVLLFEISHQWIGDMNIISTDDKLSITSTTNNRKNENSRQVIVMSPLVLSDTARGSSIGD